MQRRICKNKCNWDPSQCFLEDSHSGSLKDIMRKEFLEQYDPGFSSKFNHDKTNLRLQLDEDGHPKISELVEQLGISSELVYDKEGSPVNFDNITDKFRNEDRPLYILEEKKVTDIIVALLEETEMSINSQKNKMTKLYQDSYSNIATRPITSLMMWGPQSSLHKSNSSTECVLEKDSWNQLVLDGNLHKCLKFSEKHYWMFGHVGDGHCVETHQTLEGPVMTNKLTVVYPCSNTSCSVKCPCKLCENTSKELCSFVEHKKHVVRFHKECLIQKNSQCQDHWVTHPGQFESEEDIVVEKNLFFHNDELLDQPRNQAIEIINFAGIKKSCQECRTNLYDHFRNHLVFHLQCKFCSFQFATFVDKQFWKKVCKICGKMFDSVVPKKINWHEKCHEDSENFTCNKCGLKFKRKFTLKRHLQDDHGETLDSMEENILNHFEVPTKTVDVDSISPVKTERGYQCVACKKIFRLQRYLDRHVDLNHKEINAFQCLQCNREFKHKKNLRLHESIVHSKDESKFHKFVQNTQVTYNCDVCSKEFKRLDHLRRHKKIHESSTTSIFCHICKNKFARRENLNVHIKSVHGKQNKPYSCSTCDRKFNIKSSMVRHKKIFGHI